MWLQIIYLIELNKQAFLQCSPSLNYIFSKIVVLDYKLTFWRECLVWYLKSFLTYIWHCVTSIVWTAYSLKETDVDDVKRYFVLDKVISWSSFMVILLVWQVLIWMMSWFISPFTGHNLIWRGMIRRCNSCFDWFEEFQKGDYFLDPFDEAIRSPLSAWVLSLSTRHSSQPVWYTWIFFVSPPQYIRCFRSLRLKKNRRIWIWKLSF